MKFYSSVFNRSCADELILQIVLDLEEMLYSYFQYKPGFLPTIF